MSKDAEGNHVAEAIAILKQLGFPRAQNNARSGLTLLALLSLKPDSSWADAEAPLMGITPMMEFFMTHYGKGYKPNSRESVRRQTVHQFRDAGLILQNPNDPQRSVNSQDFVYQIAPTALALLRSFGTESWERNLQEYVASAGTLQKKYAQDRAMARIPVTIAPGKKITLSPGKHNVLIVQIINEFCSRFTPGCLPLYVGDTGKKLALFDVQRFKELGLCFDTHGKMPDIVVEHRAKAWLVLIEAVTSHGPIDPKRHEELQQLFKSSVLPLVYVTAFLTRSAMKAYLPEISWETDVWVAESPGHLIHFNGERFLGPY